MSIVLTELALQGAAAVAQFLMTFSIRAQTPSSLSDSEAFQTRVLCVGHSLTLGAESPALLTYPAQLETRLQTRSQAQGQRVQAQGQRAQVINAGKPGWPTRRHLSTLPDLLSHHRPHVLVLWSGDHDFEADTLREPAPWMTHLTQHIKLLQLGNWVWQSLRLREFNQPDPQLNSLDNSLANARGETRYADLLPNSDEKLVSLIASRVDPLVDAIRATPGPAGTSLRDLALRTQAKDRPRGLHPRHWALTRAHLHITEAADFQAALRILQEWAEQNTEPALSHLLFAQQMRDLEPQVHAWFKLQELHLLRLQALPEFRSQPDLIRRVQHLREVQLAQLSSSETQSLFEIAPELPSLAWEVIVRQLTSPSSREASLVLLRKHMMALSDSPVLGQSLLGLRYHTTLKPDELRAAWERLPPLIDGAIQNELQQRFEAALEVSAPDQMRTSLREVFGEIKKLAETSGVQRILVLGYHPVRAPRSSVFYKYRQTLNQNLEGVARELDLEFVSLERAFVARYGNGRDSLEALNSLHHQPDQLWDSHLNAAGNEFVARAVDEALSRPPALESSP